MPIAMSVEHPTRGAPERVDVVILTALKAEYDAVLQVDTGAVPGSTWERRPGPTGTEVAFRAFGAVGGSVLHVAVTRALEMGAMSAVSAVAPLVDAYAPRCLAICGVCAGRKGRVELGDVIFADTLWGFESGRQIVYSLDPKWRQRAEFFSPDPSSPWLLERPRSYAIQADWVLERLLRGEDPREHPERKQRCADFPQVLQRLRETGHITGTPPELTATGREYIQQKLYEYPDGLPEPRFRVHIGPIATIDVVMRSESIFNELSARDHRVLGLEMEAAAIVAFAHLRRLEYTLVVKGVMDFADREKHDNFKPFAARASAECLLAFLRESLEPAPLGTFHDILDTGRSPRPTDANPSALLNARYSYLPFSRRDRELEELRAWCQEPEPVCAMLLYGAGGAGKTRLLIEGCDQLRQHGWLAGFLVSPVRLERFQALLAGGQDTLVVIDYAESHWGLPGLLEAVARRRDEGRQGRFRLVLLAREPADWWSALLASSEAVRALFGHSGPRRLAPVAADQVAERYEVFQEATQHLASLLNRPVLGLPPPDLSNSRFERVLYIHLAALATLEGWPPSAEGLIGELLDHEERLWRTHLLDRVPPGSEGLKKARRAVTALTLLGGASSQQEAEELLRRVNDEPDDTLLLMLSRLYPGRQVLVGGLEPDLLGDAMVLRTLRQERDGGEELLRRTFSQADVPALRNGFEVLGRLYGESPDEAGRWMDWVLEGDLPGRAVAAFEAAKALAPHTHDSGLGARLARALEREGTRELAAQLDAAGLPDDTASLREVSVWVTKVLLADTPAGDEPSLLAERAMLLNNLGNRQSELGKVEEALEVIREAVRLYRLLAARGSEDFLPGLAMSLNNLGTTQGQLGRYEQALEAIREAVDIRRHLTQRMPEDFLPGLAMSLNNLGTMQGQLGRYEQALEAIHEAVDIRTHLTQRMPEAFLPELAMSLINLGAVQGALGKHEEALETAREAAVHYRHLAAMRPEAFLPALATSLNNLGLKQSELGRHEEALETIREAMKLYRRLAEEVSEAFCLDLAGGLSNLGLMQRALGEREEALESMRQALDTIWPLFENQPGAFAASTGRILNNLKICLEELGLAPSALTGLQERLDSYQARTAT
jgi:tetratricopeptide (TPR) repeat protein/nucleoside phosphorylase